MASSLYWPKKQLTNGVEMPAIGMAFYHANDSNAIFDAVDAALGVGYRLFDTAPVHGIEVALNRAFSELLPKYNLRREDIFISSKLSSNEMGSYDKAQRAYRRSLNHLGLDYLDLYLMHYPATTKNSFDDERSQGLRNETWSALVNLYEGGHVNAIGVSNLGINNIQDILNNKHGVPPIVSQFEFNPLDHDFNLVTYCQNLAIVVQTCHPFGGSNSNEELLQNPAVLTIARDIGATPAQVLLVWALQRNVAVAPNINEPEQIINNMNANFTLSQEQMKVLDTLDKQKKSMWDPVVVS